MEGWIVVIAVVSMVFLSGFGWGEMWAERSIRLQQQEIERGRISVSVPTNPETASKTLILLGRLIDEVEKQDQ